MHKTKLILAAVSLLMALVSGTFAFLCLIAIAPPSAPTLLEILFVLIPAFVASGMIASALFLLAKRHTPMSKKAIAAISCVWISSIVAITIGVPTFVRARTSSASNACENNLRMIEEAKRQWAQEHNESTRSHPSWRDICPYLGRGEEGTILFCPKGGPYAIGRMDQKPRCALCSSDPTSE